MRVLLTLAGAALVLTACGHAKPEASTTPAVTATSSSPPSSSAVPQPPTASGKCAYSTAGIPDRVMVRDVFHTGTGVTENCVDRRPDEAYYEYLPDPCSRVLGIRTSSIVARRAIEVLFDDNPKNDNLTNDDAQASMYRHTVTVYNSGDAASANMCSVRAAVRECPVRKLPHSTWKYTIVSSTAQRLELSVRRTQDEPAEGTPTVATFRVSIARSDARVSVLTDVGWEGAASNGPAVNALVKVAADQLERWD